jgi:monovalent cation/proton antiporter MnhG/PhaG subunit
VRNAVVDILLATGVTAELLCCLGVAVMRTTYDRLHYTAASTTVGPFCILAALLVREGFGQFGLDGIATVAMLFLFAPLVVHATARAARAHGR